MKKHILPLLVICLIVSAVYYQVIAPIPVWFLYYLLVINIVSFVCYGLDKLAALKQWQRTPEKHFYALALCAGWPGSLLGQVTFNHKTTKVSFRRWFFLMVFFNINIIFVYFYWDKLIELLR